MASYRCHATRCHRAQWSEATYPLWSKHLVFVQWPHAAIVLRNVVLPLRTRQGHGRPDPQITRITGPQVTLTAGKLPLQQRTHALFISIPAALREAQRAGTLYLIYSKADFEVFRPAEATSCTDGGLFPPPRQISPPSVQRLGYRIPKT